MPKSPLAPGRPAPIARSAVNRRLLVGVSLIPLAVAGLTALAPPASAAPWSGTLTPTVVFYNSGAGCTVASSGPLAPVIALPANTPTPFNHASATTGAGANPGDTNALNAAVAGTAHVVEAGASVSSFDISARLTAQATRALGEGSACSASANAALNLNSTFSTSSAGILVLDYDSPGTGFSQNTIVLFRAGDTSFSQLVSADHEMNGTRRFVYAVEPGDWNLFGSFGVVVSSANGPSSLAPSADVQFRLRGEFHPFGAASGRSVGTGTKYVKFPDTQTCGSHSLVADFTKKAGPKPKKGKSTTAKPRKPVIKKAIFYVNGAKVRTVKKPHKNTKVTLNNLPADEETTVSVVLKLRGKIPVTVERTYLPCS